MFRHKDKPKHPALSSHDIRTNDDMKKKDDKVNEEARNNKNRTAVMTNETTNEDEASSLKELLEKNLKWSQIIYEQNRKINRKLMWTAMAGWLRLLLILVPLVLAVLYLTPLIKDVWSKFGAVTNVVGSGGINVQGSSLDELIKVFNFSPSQKEQIKGLLK